MNEVLSSNTSISHSTCLRILALGCLDILVSLPIGIISVYVDVKGNTIVFYQGWTVIHSNWEPFAVTKEMWTDAPFGVFDLNWNEWISVYYSVVFFALFGLTVEARSKYKRALNFVLRWFGLNCIKEGDNLSTIDFGSRNAGNGTFSLPVG